jgi:polygalacturonase
MRSSLLVCSTGLLACLALVTNAQAPANAQPFFNVLNYGAKRDGSASSTVAFRTAIEACTKAGGGTVFVPAGTYVAGSIRLVSNVTLYLDAGSKIEATTDPTEYDAPEPNEWTKYQDFGHSHWHNSLIWGDGLDNVTIAGNGLISGKALSRGESGRGGNKAIALKLCRNVTIRDISIFLGGHFGILATGVDNLTIDNVKIDTNRDGIDIDACRNVRISNVSVNSPNDDAIVFKSSYALGMMRATENVTLTNSFVSGYDIGSLLDATYKRTVTRAPDREGPTGRVKIGTESNGPFRNITISNIVFDRSRGLALESVDGSAVEDIAISNITMRDVSNSPIFLRLGSRMRAPEGTPIGTLRRVSISNVVAYDADPRMPSIISGIPGHDVEDVKLSHIRIVSRGGLTLDHVAKQPAELVNRFFFRGGAGVPPREPYDTPEREKEYPEPAMFGLLPAYGFFVRHAKGIEFDDVSISYLQEDKRPAFVLDQVKGVDFERVQAQETPEVPSFVLINAQNVTVHRSPPAADTKVESAPRKEM